MKQNRKGTAQNTTEREPSIIENIAELNNPDEFTRLGEALANGKALIVIIGNRDYNKKILRASQGGTRPNSADNAHNLNGPPPIVKLVLRLNSKKEPVVNIICLNGHHRIGFCLINKQTIQAEVIYMEDQINGGISYTNMTFDDATMLKLGLSVNPSSIPSGLGFNAFLRPLKEYYKNSQSEP